MNKNQKMADKLRNMSGLTDKAREMIATTSFEILDDMFGGLDAKAINELADEIMDDEEA